MRHPFFTLVFISILVGFLGIGTAFSVEMKEEQQERLLNPAKPEKKILPSGLTMKASVSGGYDTNPNLSPLKKGDIFEEFLFNLGYSKVLTGKLKFTFNYDYDILNYNEITDASTILNHLRFGLHDRFGKLRAGAGYDLAYVYYLDNDDDFLFHKGFAYIGHDITRKIYQQLQFEYGIKDFTEQKALGDTIATFQSKDRFDRRWNGIYSIDALLTRRLSAGFLTKFSINDSNARYQNFYDYKSYEGSPYISYAFNSKLRLVLNFSYTRKNYDKRRVTFGNDREEDNLYTGRGALKYDLNKNNSLSISYTYRDNSSNEGLEEYVENIFSAGWNYKF